MLLDTRVEDFYRVALEIAGALSPKYYNVSVKYSPYDIVQELAVKIVKNNIDYDETRGSSFSSFIYMLVNKTYIDLSRSKVNKYIQTVSLDEDLQEDFTLGDIMADDFNLEEDVVSRLYCETLVENLPCDSEKDRLGDTPLGIMKLSVRSVVQLKLKGYSPDEIARFFGVNPSNLSHYMKTAKRCLYEDLALC